MGGMTREIFAEFLCNTAQLLNDEETHYLIYDGAPAHGGAADPTNDIHVKILPPYSPFLNPVEQAISCLKANIKGDISCPHIQIRMNDRQAARNAQVLLGEFRKQILIAVAERNMHCITVAKCAARARHMQTYLPRCMPCERTHPGLKTITCIAVV